MIDGGQRRFKPCRARRRAHAQQNRLGAVLASERVYGATHASHCCIMGLSTAGASPRWPNSAAHFWIAVRASRRTWLKSPHLCAYGHHNDLAASSGMAIEMTW